MFAYTAQGLVANKVINNTRDLFPATWWKDLRALSIGCISQGAIPPALAKNVENLG